MPRACGATTGGLTVAQAAVVGADAPPSASEPAGNLEREPSGTAAHPRRTVCEVDSPKVIMRILYSNYLIRCRLCQQVTQRLKRRRFIICKTVGAVLPQGGIWLGQLARTL